MPGLNTEAAGSSKMQPPWAPQEARELQAEAAAGQTLAGNPAAEPHSVQVPWSVQRQQSLGHLQERSDLGSQVCQPHRRALTCDRMQAAASSSKQQIFGGWWLASRCPSRLTACTGWR